MENEILTVREAAKFLRVHPVTLYNLLRQKRLKCQKIGGQYRFMKQSLLEYLTVTGAAGQEQT